MCGIWSCIVPFCASSHLSFSLIMILFSLWVWRLMSHHHCYGCGARTGSWNPPPPSLHINSVTPAGMNRPRTNETSRHSQETPVWTGAEVMVSRPALFWHQSPLNASPFASRTLFHDAPFSVQNADPWFWAMYPWKKELLNYACAQRLVC